MAGKIKRIVTSDSIFLEINGKKYTIRGKKKIKGKPDEILPLYTKIKDLLLKSATDPTILDSEKSPIIPLLDTSVMTKGTPFYIDPVQCVVYVDGDQVDGFYSKKIIQLKEENKPFEYIVNFWKRLKNNPSTTAPKELFLYLEHNGLPITKDGYFISYKAVRSDYYSQHGYYEGNPDNVLNKPGSWVEFDRSKVDDDRNRTCSNGLHAANYHYAKFSYGGPKIITLIIDPKDVVAIPNDYNNQKMRTCAYYVWKDTDKEYTENFLTEDVVVPNRTSENTVITAISDEAEEATQHIVFHKSYKNSTGSVFEFVGFEGRGRNRGLNYKDSVTGATIKVFLTEKVPTKWVQASEELVYEKYLILRIDETKKETLKNAISAVVPPSQKKTESVKVEDTSNKEPKSTLKGLVGKLFKKK